jgi:hypothetical protein
MTRPGPEPFLFPQGGLQFVAVDWVFELQAPNTIHPLGFRKNLLAPGDEVTVDLQPTKNGNPNGRLLRLVLADGTELDPQSFRNGRGGRGDETQ